MDDKDQLLKGLVGDNCVRDKDGVGDDRVDDDLILKDQVNKDLIDDGANPVILINCQ